MRAPDRVHRHRGRSGRQKGGEESAANHEKPSGSAGIAAATPYPTGRGERDAPPKMNSGGSAGRPVLRERRSPARMVLCASIIRLARTRLVRFIPPTFLAQRGATFFIGAGKNVRRPGRMPRGRAHWSGLSGGAIRRRRSGNRGDGLEVSCRHPLGREALGDCGAIAAVDIRLSNEESASRAMDRAASRTSPTRNSKPLRPWSTTTSVTPAMRDAIGTHPAAIASSKGHRQALEARRRK